MENAAHIVSAIERYLEILTSHVSSEDENIKKLMRSLDELAYLSHGVAYESDDHEYPEPPENDHETIVALVRQRFPSLGYYNVAGHIADHISTTELHIGDALDDIADIAADLQKILWHLQHTSIHNGLFYFELGFRGHWGRHLRQLQLYLHEQWHKDNC